MRPGHGETSATFEYRTSICDWRRSLGPAPPALRLDAPHIEDVQNGTIGGGGSGALGDGSCEQSLEPAQIADPGADVVEVTGCNSPHFPARGLLGAAEPKQSADVVEREPEFPCTAQESQNPDVAGSVDAAAARGAGRRRQHRSEEHTSELQSHSF